MSSMVAEQRPSAICNFSKSWAHLKANLPLSHAITYISHIFYLFENPTLLLFELIIILPYGSTPILLQVLQG